jgi:hypothetical protein
MCLNEVTLSFGVQSFIDLCTFGRDKRSNGMRMTYAYVCDKFYSVETLHLSGSENKTTQSTPLPTYIWHSILNKRAEVSLVQVTLADCGFASFYIFYISIIWCCALDFGRVLVFRVESFKTSRVARNQCGRRRWDMGEFIYDVWERSCMRFVRYSARTPSANSRSQPAETTQVRFTPFVALIYLLAEPQQRTHVCV